MFFVQDSYSSGEPIVVGSIFEQTEVEQDEQERTIFLEKAYA